MNLGIDIGRVIIAPGGGGGREDTSFIEGSLADALQTPPIEGAFDAVRFLVEVFAGEVWLSRSAAPECRSGLAAGWTITGSMNIPAFGATE